MIIWSVCDSSFWGVRGVCRISRWGLSFKNRSQLELPFAEAALRPPPSPLNRSSPRAPFNGFELMKWWHRATAIPSVASSRRGGRSIVSMLLTRAATCSLGAEPRPVIHCLMRVGAYSNTCSPRLNAAAIATPCARPSLSIDCTFSPKKGDSRATSRGRYSSTRAPTRSKM